MNTTRKRMECVVRGRVQLVMFRDFTKRSAEKFGIVGSVRNENDGTVRVVAEGEEATLAAFLKRLEEGLFLSRVDPVETTYTDPTGNFSTSESLCSRSRNVFCFLPWVFQVVYMYDV